MRLLQPLAGVISRSFEVCIRHRKKSASDTRASRTHALGTRTPQPTRRSDELVPAAPRERVFFPRPRVCRERGTRGWSGHSERNLELPPHWWRSWNSPRFIGGWRVALWRGPLACAHRSGTAGLPRTRAACAARSAAPTRRLCTRSADQRRSSDADGGARRWPMALEMRIRCAAAAIERALGAIGGGRVVSMRNGTWDSARASTARSRLLTFSPRAHVCRRRSRPPPSTR